MRDAALVGTGLGIMLVPSLAMSSLRPDIAVRRLPPSFPARTIYAAVPSGYRTPAADEMLDCLREVAESPMPAPDRVDPGRQ